MYLSIWGELQQEAFEMIKKDLTEAPVLAMLNNKGHMVLVSDTSKIACGSALYQEQKGRYRLIAYFSKKLPLSAQRYSISELELTGIYVVPPQSWGDRSDTKHSKCLLLGGRRLNQLTLIPKPKGSGGARAAMAQVGPANKRNDRKRCLPVEALLRPGEAVPW